MKFCYYFFLLILFASCADKDFKGTKKEQNNAPKIVAVYPTTDSLPENLLRFYIQFSQSMKAVNNLENIKLLNENGEEIEGAIFNNVYELWDSEQKQLTLILDPSRVKTGLKANQTLGRALVPGQHFQLIIEKAEDIHGKPLATPFIKNIYVQPEDKEIPDIDNWKIHAPKSGSKSALTIHFPQVLDRMSLLHRIQLLNAKKERIIGKIELTNKETEWQFRPNKIWKKGSYTLQINKRLEDPAGNNLNGLFDHEIGGLRDELEGGIFEVGVFVE